MYLIIHANLTYWKQTNKYESVRGKPVKNSLKEIYKGHKILIIISLGPKITIEDLKN